MILAEEGLFRIIGFDPQLIWDTMITGLNVFVLFFGLSYFLFNPIQKVLKDRKDRIKNELENAKNAESSALAMKEEYEKKLADTRLEVERMLDEAKKNAKIMSEDIVAKAHTEATSIVSRGRIEVEQEKAKAIEELKDKVIEISTLLASKVVKENISSKSEEKLFDETLKEIGDASWQS